MIFSEIKPSPQLSPFVKFFWWMELDCRSEQGQFTERILPDGSTEMIFHLGENIGRVVDENRWETEPDSLFIGQNTVPYVIGARGVVKMLGIKFHPHAAAFLLRENAAQFKDAVIDLRDLWGNSIPNLHERVAVSDSLEGRITLVEEFLARHFSFERSSKFDYLTSAIQGIVENRGQIRLTRLTDRLGMTRRYLEQLFRTYVGISPKSFAQIVQLQYSIQLLNSTSNSQSLTDICYASGYYDQAHFIHSIKRLTGLTPSQIRHENLLMQQPFLAPNQY